MEFYKVCFTTYHNDEKINSIVGETLTEKKPNNYEISFTWDNLDNLMETYGLETSFNVWNLKKGRRISFFTDKFFPNKNTKDIKEWKEKELNIKLKVTYTLFSPSLEKVFKWHDSDKAIQYLKEKGLNFEKCLDKQKNL